MCCCMYMHSTIITYNNIENGSPELCMKMYPYAMFSLTFLKITHRLFYVCEL